MEVGEVPGIWKIGEEDGNSLEMKGLVRGKARSQACMGENRMF